MPEALSPGIVFLVEPSEKTRVFQTRRGPLPPVDLFRGL